MELQATLIKQNQFQRFYQLNTKLKKGLAPLSGKVFDLVEKLKESKERDFKPEYKQFCPTDGIDIICVSDAHTHLERLVFAAMYYGEGEEREVGRMRVQIDGAHTMMIHGGDSRKMKPDHVYLRRLAKINGLEYHINRNQRTMKQTLWGNDSGIFDTETWEPGTATDSEGEEKTLTN